MTNVIKFFEDKTEPMREFIIHNQGNPVFWTSIVVGGLILYGILYSYFNRNN